MVVDESLSEKNNDDDATFNCNTVDTNENVDIGGVGVADESLPYLNYYYDTTVNYGNVENIEEWLLMM